METAALTSELLWLTQPAARWLDAFPLGNGRLGAMVFGGAEYERLALNHENLWRGVTRDRTTQPKFQHLAEIREKLFARQWVEATELATRYLSGGSGIVQPYQPVGDLTLTTPEHADIAEYRRSLALATGIAETSYRVGAVTYRREAFASAVHGVIVLRVSADHPNAISTTIALSRVEDPECTLQSWATTDRLGFEGQFPEGITFATEARVITRGGVTAAGEGATVTVTGADELLVALTIAVDYLQPAPGEWCARQLDTVPLDYATLRDAHVAEHRALYERVRLQVPANAAVETLPLDARLLRLREGGEDPGMAALYFQYGRYLLLNSSRCCDQPANLQGVWNEALRPPWESDFHHDINIQMNYWPAEVCNLAECADPLVSYLWRAVPEGKKAARDLYNCRGIYLPITDDVWDRATPEAPGWDVWTGAAAWLTEPLWRRYEYTLDVDYLREKVYPFLELVADFYQDYLVRDEQGRLVTAPSQSPENTFVGGASPVSLCIGSTMDFLLIREVLTRCIHASEALECGEEKRLVWARILDDLPPFQIGRHGQLQEWLEDFEEAEPGHRHVSHLIGVFPGEQMTPEILPEFYQAARVSLERRLACGGGHTGWSRAWVAALWARFREGGLAYEHLVHLITDFATNSLLDLHPPQIFQIDGNLGGTAAVAELLLQSHAGVIRLLPALPPQWPHGSINGLQARGGFTVKLRWQDGALAEARLHSHLGQPCRIAWNGASCHASCNGIVLPLERDAHGYLHFHISAGECLVLRAEG